MHIVYNPAHRSDLTLISGFLPKFDPWWPLTGHNLYIIRLSSSSRFEWCITCRDYLLFLLLCPIWPLFQGFDPKFDLWWPMTGHKIYKFGFNLKFRIFWCINHLHSIIWKIISDFSPQNHLNHVISPLAARCSTKSYSASWSA